MADIMDDIMKAGQEDGHGKTLCRETQAALYPCPYGRMTRLILLVSICVTFAALYFIWDLAREQTALSKERSEVNRQAIESTQLQFEREITRMTEDMATLRGRQLVHIEHLSGVNQAIHDMSESLKEIRTSQRAIEQDVRDSLRHIRDSGSSSVGG